MGPNVMQLLQQFIFGARQQYGSNFDPSVIAKNMLGNNCATPQQALQQLFQSGKINQAQFEMFSKML